MNHRAALVTAGLTAALALAPLSAAQAAPKPRIDVDGLGTYTLGTGGAAIVTTSVTGVPFAGQATAVLRPQDGTLPEPGQCEPGTVTVRIDGSRGRYLELSSSDDVCGEYVQPPSVVTHVFTGVYDVTSASERRLQGGDGFVEIRLTNDGRASVFAIDT